MFVKADWNDQGFGNTKGSIIVQLVNAQGVEDPQFFQIGPCPKNREMKDYSTQDHQILRNATMGSCYRVKYKVGGGGGHKLQIHQFLLSYY
jgi:hypothetical protein